MFCKNMFVYYEEMGGHAHLFAIICNHVFIKDIQKQHIHKRSVNPCNLHVVPWHIKWHTKKLKR